MARHISAGDRSLLPVSHPTDRACEKDWHGRRCAHPGLRTGWPELTVTGAARLRVLLPVASSAIRFRNVTADADGIEIHHHLIAVIDLVADDLLQTLAVWRHRLDLFGGFDQRLDARRRIARVRILHRHADDGAGLEIDRMFGFMAKWVR